MATNPYQETDLPDALWEVEMVADKFYNGGVILIRTKDGWRAFFGHFEPKYFESIETELDKDLRTYESVIIHNYKRPRMKKLTDDIKNLLTYFFEAHPGVDYYPMKFVYDLPENNDKDEQ